MFVYGGLNTEGLYLDDLQVFDFKLKKWGEIDF